MIDGLVVPAFLHGDTITATWHYSFFELMLRDLSTSGRVGPPVSVHCGAGRIAEGRNQCVQQFLQTDGEWLWFVDTDMGFAPDAVDRLVEAADPVARPVVGGLCFGLMLEDTDPDYHSRTMRIAPTLYTVNPDSGEFSRLLDYPADELMQVAATGAACLLIHRDLLEKVRADHGERWFSQLPDGTAEWRMAGEDVSFCARAYKAGGSVWVHTGVKTAHDKGGQPLTEELYLRQRQVAVDGGD